HSGWESPKPLVSPGRHHRRAPHLQAVVASGREGPMIVPGSGGKLLQCVCVAILAAGTMSAQTSTPAPEAVDVQKLGPQVGAKVPDFKLNDQQGQPRTLRSVMGPKGALLVFFRSADW